jgi:pimeloyl-ACP methyl ester carboxylesterase
MPEGSTVPMVLIHGAWLSSNSWDNFVTYFGEHGYQVSAPEWPRKQEGVEAQREHSEDLAGLGVTEIVDHYEAIIRGLDEPPVIMGHSFGGLFTQLLLDRGLGRAGVAMSPAQPKGILRLPLSTLKSASPALAHPSRRHGVVPLTLEEFTYAFVNTLSPEDAKAAYETYCVPETGQIFYEAGFANFQLHSPTKIDWDNPNRAPLLVVGAEKDHTITASLSRDEFKKQSKSPSPTAYLEFEGRPHMMMAVEGWEEIASGIDDWLTKTLKA